MIDKKIYYCWFGDKEMSDLNRKCLETWDKYCPTYDKILINEDNYDYKSNPYAKDAYERGDWSAVSNAARLWFLKNESGFYLDTDVRLVKSLDDMCQFDGGFYTEFDSGEPDSGVLGRGSKCPKAYEEIYDRLVPGTIMKKEALQVLYRDYDIRGQRIQTYDDGFTILGEEYFPSVRTGLFTNKTIGIHYFENTWIKIKRQITDGFYPFPRAEAYLGNTLIHKDENPEIVLVCKNLKKNWCHPDILGRTCYFFNPKVVRLISRDFEAEKIDYDRSKPMGMHVTVSGMLVGYIKEDK